MSAARHRRTPTRRLLRHLRARFCTWLEPAPTGPYSWLGDRWEAARIGTWRTW